ncbi:MAG: hypothetical protein IPL64_09680 [Flavobacteriales bacterium]|jgi:hypothetical protein|nr:hypothetical protein [Flavobacteriales bacterium]MBK6550974.1 hypothetical protein [Flavobacteriales bacterium]MBK7101254.1 hypothetical protein [Flavobacteriales bacterium]MBK8532150.1 hypothetical protein [Flavobacteriales bacterium]MBK8707672.1 hypothetical protein [Flavobacteriales bacterium]
MGITEPHVPRHIAITVEFDPFTENRMNKALTQGGKQMENIHIHVTDNSTALPRFIDQ